jgi:hypothetical protein
MRRISNWNKQMRSACRSEFLRLLKTGRKEQVANAIAAGRSLAKLMENAGVIITGIDCVQMERYRRRFAVAKNCKGIMYGVATGQLTNAMLETRLDRKFPSYRLPSGKVRFVDRCQLCSKRVCRCVIVPDQKRKARAVREPHRFVGKVVSLRGIPTAVKI